MNPRMRAKNRATSRAEVYTVSILGVGWCTPERANITPPLDHKASIPAVRLPEMGARASYTARTFLAWAGHSKCDKVPRVGPRHAAR
eukprot:2709731-Prymnesium_polylepis.1